MNAGALVLAVVLATSGLHAAPPCPVVTGGQTKSYDNHSEIPPPKPGQTFYGQDAQNLSNPPSYTLSADGLTVYDNVTDLTWQNSPETNGDDALNRGDKLTLKQAEGLPSKLNATRFGGFSDWRLPTIKELYSLFDTSGTDPSGPGSDNARLTPFIDTRYFKFAYGDTNKGERLIDSQYASSTKYVGKSFRGYAKLFGVNFADGRIKGYDLLMPGGAMEKTFFVQCVRGNPQYGQNIFHDNGDGIITDRATALMWSKTDSGKGMNWQDALAWVQKKNAENFLGHHDWRMPSIKELQSIVDYARSPDTTDSAAIDPVFQCSQITNESGQPDYPYYWSGTTHASYIGGANAMYIAFGRAGGWMSPRPLTDGPQAPPKTPGNASGKVQFVDVHGAGSQRSDPKAGDPKNFPSGRGPQGDAIRINNYVRCVRGG